MARMTLISLQLHSPTHGLAERQHDGAECRLERAESGPERVKPDHHHVQRHRFSRGDDRVDQALHVAEQYR